MVYQNWTINAIYSSTELAETDMTSIQIKCRNRKGNMHNGEISECRVKSSHQSGDRATVIPMTLSLEDREVPKTT